MPFIRRNAQGVVESLHRRADGGAEFLPEDHPEVRAFLAGAAAPGAPAAADASPHEERFAELDADFVRVIEDVIDTLISKNVINITDLPPEAQTKLFGRKSFRERANRDALRLFGEGETD
jgi:hypothetical protein